MRNYSDPTANAAIGAVDREFKSKKKLAKRLRALWLEGKLTDHIIEQALPHFSGIFSSLWADIFREEEEKEEETEETK